jgi:cytochrome b involved in lipid metabolism
MSSWLFNALGYTEKEKDARKKAPAKRDLPQTPYTKAEVAQHRSGDSIWIVIENRVCDITEYVKSGQHPGGDIILDGAGRDATDLFRDVGHPQDALDVLDDLQIGILVKEKPVSVPSETTTTSTTTE